MSVREPDRRTEGERSGLVALEQAVERLLDHVHVLRGRLQEAEDRAEQTGELLRGFTSGVQDPQELVQQVERLEQENAELRGRLEQGKEGVDQILAKIRFLEENG